MTNAIDTAREYWNLLAARDPLWAVLSDSSKTDRRWDLPSFMATGEREISLLFHELGELNLAVTMDTSVDFGCGVGRLTQALARRFRSVLGLDVSPEMVRIARHVNRYGDRVRHETNTEPLSKNLPAGSVDFVYSNLVLQHVHPDLSSVYLADLVKSLRPGGLFVFQLPSTRADTPRGPVPMAESAYRASVSLSRAIPGRVTVESSFQVPVEIVNVSDQAWSQADVGAIRAGNHWLDTHAGMVVQDDGRAALPAALGPTERCRIDLEVHAPAHPGQYLLELDVVHEGITWFADRGSRALRVPVEVLPATAQSVGATGSERTARAGGASLPRVLPNYSDINLTELLPAPDGVVAVSDFPMYGIPRETVAGIVAASGGEIVHVIDDDHAKPEWNGYRYFVRKPRDRR